MRPVLILLLLYCGPAFGQPGERWYKVTGSDNELWDSASNIIMRLSDDSDTVDIWGFTRQGAHVRGTIRDGRITIPAQTRTISPFGGDGTARWDVTVSAAGSISDSGLTLGFRFRRDTFETAGNITARRWNTALENARIRYERANPDTVIKGIAYPVRLYDANKRLIALGQRYRHRVKNGRWIFFGNDSTLYREACYVNDTLHGWYAEGLARRSRGVYIRGVRTGIWIYQRKKGRRWIPERFEVFDAGGGQLASGDLYPSGRTSREIFKNRSGEPEWYIHYREDGSVSYEGPADAMPIIPLETTD